MATLERLLTSKSDDQLPRLRHLLEVPPNLDLIIRIADDPTIARRALEAQAALTNLRERLFFSDDDPLSYAQMDEVCRALNHGTESSEDLRLLWRFWSELVDVYLAAGAVSLLVTEIGKHRSTWSRDRRWRRFRSGTGAGELTGTPDSVPAS